MKNSLSIKEIMTNSLCVYSNSRNGVPRVAQRYGTIAAHTRRRASVLVVFVVFCVHMHSFAGLIRRTPPTFSDTAITNRHSDHYFPAQSSLGADILVYWIGKTVRTCAPGGSRTLDFLRARRAPYPLGQALRSDEYSDWFCPIVMETNRVIPCSGYAVSDRSFYRSVFKPPLYLDISPECQR